MSPAFSSPKHAGGFALLLLLILLLPALVGKSHLPPREEVYSATPWRFGPYPFLHQQIFEEKGDIDIAFMGSSHIWSGIDTPYVQQEASRMLGRKATVISLGWPWPGFDALYFIAQDLLRNRKVHMLVIHEEFRGPLLPHTAASRWFRFGDNTEALAGLPLQTQAGYYADAIRGMPRNLLSLIRPNLPVQSVAGKKNYWESFYQAPNPADKLGALCAQIGFNYNPDFVEYTPGTQLRESDAYVYSPETKGKFEFSGEPTPPAQLHFARKVAELAKEHGTTLVFLHLPESTEMRATAIHEREFWPDALHADVQLMGIPPATLFAGLKDEEVLKLFYDSGHFNKNGQNYFSKSITARLLELYAPANPR